MKKTQIRLIAALLLLALTALLLCGCGSKTEITITADSDISLPVMGISVEKPVTSSAVQMGKLLLTLSGEGTGSVKAIVDGSEVIFTVTVKDGKAAVTSSPEIVFTWEQK